MRCLLILAAAALIATPAAADTPKGGANTSATAKAATKAGGSKPTDAQLKRARDILSMFVSAFNSSEVPQPTKEGLFICLYGNPLGKIARAHAEAMTAAKLSATATPTQKLAVLAGLCNAPWPTSAADKTGAR